MKKLMCLLVILGVASASFATSIERLHIYNTDGYYNNVAVNAHYFLADLEGAGVTSADIQLSSASGDDYLYDLAQEGPGLWRYESQEYGSRSAMLVDHPGSTWNFWWMPEDEEWDVAFNSTKPSGIASFTSVDTSTNPVFEWSFNPADGDALTADIFDIDTDEVVYSEQWIDIYSAPSTWAPGELEANGNYELRVAVWDVDISGGFIGSPFTTFSSYGNVNVSIFTVVPEPATIFIIGMGALLIRKKRNK